MKVVCGGCQAKYQVPDERVAGKKLKIRCRRCSETIIVRGDTAPAVAREAGGGRGAASTPAPPSVDPHEWYASVDGAEHGPMDRQALIAWLEASPTAWEAFVWREGFSAWKMAREVPELVTAAGREHRERHSAQSLPPLPTAQDVDWDDDAEPTRMLKLSPRLATSRQDSASADVGHRASISAFGAQSSQPQAKQQVGQFDMRAASAGGVAFRHATSSGGAYGPAAFAGGATYGGVAEPVPAPPTGASPQSLHNSGFRPAAERRYTPPPVGQYEPEEDADLIDYDDPGRGEPFGDQGRQGYFARRDSGHFQEHDNGEYADNGQYADSGEYADNGQYTDDGQYLDQGQYGDNGQHADFEHDLGSAFGGEQAYHGGAAYASSMPPVPTPPSPPAVPHHERHSAAGRGRASQQTMQGAPLGMLADELSAFGTEVPAPAGLGGMSNGWGAEPGEPSSQYAGAPPPLEFPSAGQLSQSVTAGPSFPTPDSLSPLAMEGPDEKARKLMPYAIVGAAATLVGAVLMVVFLLQSDDPEPTADPRAAVAATTKAAPEQVVEELASAQGAAAADGQEPVAEEYNEPAAPPAARRRRGVGLGVDVGRRHDPEVEAANRARLDALNRGERVPEGAAARREAQDDDRAEPSRERERERGAPVPAAAPQRQAGGSRDPMADLLGGDGDNSDDDPMSGLDSESGSARAVPAAPEPARAGGSGDSLDDLLAGVGNDQPASAASAAADDGDRSIDDLLSGAVKGGGSAPGAVENLPQQPARDDVLKALKAVTPRVQRCATGAGATGMAKVTLTVDGATGRVAAASVSGVEGQASACIEQEVRAAKFPRFRKAQFNVTFPFRLQ